MRSRRYRLLDYRRLRAILAEAPYRGLRPPPPAEPAAASKPRRVAPKPKPRLVKIPASPWGPFDDGAPILHPAATATSDGQFYARWYERRSAG